MKSILKIIVVATLFFSQACKEKDAQINSSGKSAKSPIDELISTSSPSFQDVYGSFTITSRSPIGKNYHTYSSIGYYFNQEQGTGGDVQDGGILEVNSNIIPQRTDLVYGLQDQNLLGSIFQSTSPPTLTLQGNSNLNIPSYSFSSSMPENIIAQIGTFSKSQGISLTWNQSSSNNHVLIALKNEDSTREFVQFVSDNGSYTISSSNLTDFVAGERLEILIGRASGNGQTMSINGYSKSFIFSGITYQSETYILR